MDGTYTNEQKEELSKLFAGLLWEALNAPHTALMKKVVVEMKQESAKLPWFQYAGNEYGILRHLEEAGVYGIFQFQTEERSALYLRSVFSEKFFIFAKQYGLSKAAFVKAFLHPKNGATKPTLEMLKGEVSAAGNSRTRISRIG